jgi:hypothetical protein
MSNPPSKASAHIPVISDLVVPGNPRLRQQANDRANSQANNYVDALNLRIDELESAIGQDTMGSQSRAYAIRAEANRGKTPPAQRIKGSPRKPPTDDKGLS